MTVDVEASVEPTIRDEVVYRQLGKVLWDIAGVETGAAAACGLMASTPFVTAGERRFLRERMWPEERGHERIMARWGRAWYGPRARRLRPYAATVWRDLTTGAHLPPRYRFAYAFATIHWNEVNTLRSQREILNVLEAVDREAAADFRQIVGEESRSRELGRRHPGPARARRTAPVAYRRALHRAHRPGLPRRDQALTVTYVAAAPRPAARRVTQLSPRPPT